jgi:hypothetical protein
MSGRGGRKDKRIKHAMAFLLRCQGCRQCAGILPLSSWRCRPRRDGVVVVDAQASLPSSQWRCFPRRDGIFAVADAQASFRC